VPMERINTFIAHWRKPAKLMSTAPGLRDSRLHRALSSRTRSQIVNVAHWDSRQAWEAAAANPEFQYHLRTLADDTEVRISANGRPPTRSSSTTAIHGTHSPVTVFRGPTRAPVLRREDDGAQTGEHAEHGSRALTVSATRKRGRSYGTDPTPVKFGRPIRPGHKGEVSG
jgi:heme-degrading monooxygenase HmoA